MSYLHPDVLDNGLSVLDTATTTLHICSAEPADFAGVAGVSLGNKSGLSIGAPENRTPSGRKVVVAAITSGGNVTGTGSAGYWAIVDTANSKLLAANSLASSQSVTSGNSFTLPAFDIGIPGAA